MRNVSIQKSLDSFAMGLSDNDIVTLPCLSCLGRGAYGLPRHFPCTWCVRWFCCATEAKQHAQCLAPETVVVDIENKEVREEIDQVTTLGTSVSGLVEQYTRHQSFPIQLLNPRFQVGFSWRGSLTAGWTESDAVCFRVLLTNGLSENVKAPEFKLLLFTLNFPMPSKFVPQIKRELVPSPAKLTWVFGSSEVCVYESHFQLFRMELEDLSRLLDRLSKEPKVLVQ